MAPSQEADTGLTNPSVQVFTEVPQGLLVALSHHVPYSLPLLRRLQFTSFPAGKTRHARIVVAADSPLEAAYVDVSRGRETSVWLYSTLEDTRTVPPTTTTTTNGTVNGNGEDATATATAAAAADGLAPSLTPQETSLCEAQILAVTREIQRLGRDRKAYLHELPASRQPADPDAVLIGTLNTVIHDVLSARGVPFFPRPEADDYEKFVFRLDDVPGPEAGGEAVLPAGMRWDTATVEDCKVVVSRTHIPRSAETLSTLQSMFVKLDDGTPVAWAFLGPDASLSSVHCEEPYRRQGLARAVSAKLLREKTSAYGKEPFSTADVAPRNSASQAMCQSLNGRRTWVVRWVLLDSREDGTA